MVLQMLWVEGECAETIFLIYIYIYTDQLNIYFQSCPESKGPALCKLEGSPHAELRGSLFR